MADQKLLDAIKTVVEYKAGFGVELFDMLRLYPLEDGSYIVSDEDEYGKLIEENEFDDVHDAIDFFLSHRVIRQLGLDFERITAHQNPSMSDPVVAQQSSSGWPKSANGLTAPGWAKSL